MAAEVAIVTGVGTLEAGALGNCTDIHAFIVSAEFVDGPDELHAMVSDLCPPCFTR
jgi:hypothetical protein